MKEHDLPPLPEWLTPEPDAEFWGEEQQGWRDVWTDHRRLLIGSLAWMVAAMLVTVSLIWMLVPA